MDVQPQIRYLIKITDKTGVIEHAKGAEPDLAEGYSADDNARALSVVCRYINKYPDLGDILPVYFNYLKAAVQPDGFKNDLEADGQWKKAEPKGEHFGRALAALGEVVRSQPQLAGEAKILFDRIYEQAEGTPHLRTAAQIICGLKNYRSGEIEKWAEAFLQQYWDNKLPDWEWPEDELSYDIGRPVMAMLTANEITNSPEYLKAAEEMLSFLIRKTYNPTLDFFSFPGNRGWFKKTGEINIYAQQPLEAGSVAECFYQAYKLTGKFEYQELAKKAFAWYSGLNIKNAKMIDGVSGGIYDGIEEEKINTNQGAESVLSYLLAASVIG